jgi:hypothetical protein
MATGTAPLLPFPPAAWRDKTIAKRVPVIHVSPKSPQTLINKGSMTNGNT